MDKIIGYTPESDIDEFEDDGFIRVVKDASKDFTEKVSFTESDINVSCLSTLSEELEDFNELDVPIMVSNFTKEVI